MFNPQYAVRGPVLERKDVVKLLCVLILSVLLCDGLLSGMLPTVSLLSLSGLSRPYRMLPE